MEGWHYYGCAAMAGAVLLPIIVRLARGTVNYKDKHVVISGGSSGIGLSVAKEFAKRGSHVTIVARTESKLKEAVADISAGCSPDQKINYVSADMTDFEAVQACISKVVELAGRPVDVLVANAGTGIPGYFLEQEARPWVAVAVKGIWRHGLRWVHAAHSDYSAHLTGGSLDDVSVFKKAMETNYMSTVHLIKAGAPGMIERRQGQIVIVASAAAVVSFIGYSTYAPTKFALRGLADALRNEFLGFNVSVHIAYPPDTDTPGYAEEQKIKPKECAEFSALVGTPFSPASVAQSLVAGLSRRHYHLPSPDFLQNRLVDTMVGVTPRNNAALEWLALPLLAVVEWLFLRLIDHFGARYGARMVHTRKDKDS